MTTSPTHARPAQSSRFRRGLWFLGACAIAASTAFGAASSIPTAQQAANAAPVGGGLYINIGDGHQSWMGGYQAPSNADQEYPVYCVQMWLPNPTPADVVTKSTLSESRMLGPEELHLNTQQMAFVFSQHAKDQESVNQAAVSLLVHTNFEQNQAGRDIQESVNHYVNQVKAQRMDVYNRAVQYAAEARSIATSGYSEGSHTGDNDREGVIKDIQGFNERGEAVANIPIRVELSGPAVFTETGTNTWNGVSTTTPETLHWKATGNGEVSYKIYYTSGIRRTFTKYVVGWGVQETLTYGDRNAVAGDPEEVEKPGPKWNAVFDFQPEGTSNVGESKYTDGKSISDTLTASAKKDYGDGKWLKIDGKNVPVKYEGTAYYTGENAPTASNEVPADAKAVGTATLTFDGEGTQTATVTPTEELKPGFVTWVWKVTKNNQGDYSKYIHEDWTDGYAAANETNSFRHKSKINTAASIRTTQGGTYMVDDMWVDGLPTNHGEFTGNAEFDKDGATLKQDLLFFPKGTEVKEANKDKAEVISSTTVPAKNGFYPSIGTNGFKLKEGASGTYVFVTSFEGDSRVEAYTSSVEDVTEQYTVDTPEETPTIGTTATDTKDGDKEINPTGPVSITDRVCYENLKPGKEYTLTGTLMDKTTGEAFRNEKGEDISSSTTFTAKEAKGCENVVFETTGETLKGHDTVVFENMFSDNKRIAVHADINDEGQTVHPKVTPSTTAPAAPAPKGGKLAHTGAIAGGVLAVAGASAIGGGVLLMKRRRNEED